MSDYEFWNEIGKIFNAVVAYQEKSVEFNKRFINPWIRLGNVFDKQDRNTEAVSAYRKAIELDPQNADNWFELGNVYFRMESYGDAEQAYNQAVVLNPSAGWSYSNLAFTLAKQGKYAEALPLYQRGIELLQCNEDKAVVWNRLGNLYRKLNEYDLAVNAFQTADDLDEDNAGFRDELDEVPDQPMVVEGSQAVEVVSETVPAADISATDTPVEQPAVADDLPETAPSQTDLTDGTSSPDAAADDRNADDTVTAPEAVESPAASDASVEAVAQSDNTASPSDAQIDSTVQDATEAVSATDIQEAVDAVAETSTATDAAEEISIQTINVTVEINTDSQVVDAPADGNAEATQSPDDVLETANVNADAVNPESPVGAEDAPVEAPTAEVVVAVAEVGAQAESDPVLAVASEPQVTEVVVDQIVESAGQTVEVIADQIIETGGDAPIVVEETVVESVAPAHAAYDEFLKDNGSSLQALDSDSEDSDPVEQEAESASQQDPVTKIEPSGEVEIEVDTKNARVWNELGNVYFNTGAYEDAVTAYSKAIELDRQFAWPYSNLALTYVQKGRFVEAILLYQRSIELFASEKDKAISWNRLGNVYRRINDYDNAILAYQQADELDPDNITLSLQSRFSLLGNYLADSKPSYAS